MSGEVQKFDGTTLNEVVTNRIKAGFAGLIPQEAWDSLIETVRKKLFEPKQDTGYNNYKQLPSELEEILTNMMKEKIKEELKKYFTEPQWTEQWTTGGNGRRIASEAITSIIVENSGKIFENMIGLQMQSVVTSAIHSMSSSNGYR